MATVLHEIWFDYDDRGMPLPACLLAGPRGDAARRDLGPKARLIRTFEAGCHAEAMGIYNRFLGRGAYEPSDPWDTRPYPEDWAASQTHD